MQISWWTLVIQGLNFLVLVWLLQRFLYRPVQEVIEKRKRVSLDATEVAQKTKSEADALKAHYEQALAGIDDERKAAVEKAKTAIEAERRKILDQAATSASETREKELREIQNEKAAARDALRSDVVELATKMATTLLNHIAPSIPNDVVLTRLEEELKKLDDVERRRLENELAADDAVLEIITARPLAADELENWKVRIGHVLGHRLDIVFSHDATLISGAVLSLPHTVIRTTWSDQLKRAKATLLRGGHADVS